MPPTHITVTAPAGRATPIHPTDGAGSSGMLLIVEHGTVCRVRYSQATRRSMNRGDLLLCDVEGNLVKTVEDAACPSSLDEGDKLTADHLAARRAARAMPAVDGKDR